MNDVSTKINMTRQIYIHFSQNVVYLQCTETQLHRTDTAPTITTSVTTLARLFTSTSAWQRHLTWESHALTRAGDSLAWPPMQVLSSLVADLLLGSLEKAGVVFGGR